MKSSGRWRHIAHIVLGTLGLLLGAAVVLLGIGVFTVVRSQLAGTIVGGSTVVLGSLIFFYSLILHVLRHRAWPAKEPPDTVEGSGAEDEIR